MIEKKKEPSSAGSSRADLEAMLGRDLTLSAVLAEKEIALEELLRYTLGSVIVLGEAKPGTIRLEVDGTEVGRGTAVQQGNKLALRLDRTGEPRDFLENYLSTE